MITRLRQTLVPPLWALAKRIPGGVKVWELGVQAFGLTPLPPPSTAPVVATDPTSLPPPSFSRLATVQDVLYCYRLLLLREPDEAGWQTWTRHVQRHQVVVEALRDAFLACEEFQQLEAERSRPHLTEVDGFKLFYLPRDWAVGNEIARAGAYELHVAAALKPLLQPGLVFLDIGANIGYYTLLAASRVGPTGRVIAFEPHPRNVELLTVSVRENGFEHVQIYPLAVSNVEGAVELIGDPTSTNASFAVPGVSDSADIAKAHHVKTVVLDKCLQAEPRIDIVKMDIEGVEPLAWQGMRQLIQRHRPIVLTEFSPEAIRHQGFATPEEYLAMIRAMGYQLHILDSSTYTMTPALSDVEIMSRQAKVGIHHLDLVAFPQ